jgi:hypothetical protein
MQDDTERLNDMKFKNYYMAKKKKVNSKDKCPTRRKFLQYAPQVKD